MKLKIAALVTPDMVEITKEIGNNMDELSIVIDVYHDPKEAISLLNKYLDHNDILLFGGPIPYLVALNYLNENEMKVNKHIIHVPYNEISIYRGLFKMIEEMKINEYQHFKFSIDYPIESEIRECLEELEISTDKTYTKECGINQDLDELVLFHYNLWKYKKVQAAVTSVFSIFERLHELGVPVYRISPAKSSIRNTIHRALLEGKTMHQAQSQIAIGMIGINDHTHANKSQTSEYQLKRKKLALQQALVDFGEEIQALIDWSDSEKIRFITTRGQIERCTNQFKKITILKSIQEKLNIPTSMGIGFGSTAYEAEIKAHEALSKALAFSASSCFIVEMDGNVHGPIGETFQLKYSTRSDDPELISIAKKAGLSVGTINKLLSFCEYSNNKKFTAIELSSGFGITLRSARRILSKLEQSKIVKISGEEQPIGRGRPRQIYTLTLNI